MQGINAFLWSLGPWNWLILAVALFLLEALIPGIHFLWFGLAAVVVAVFAIATGVTWQWQLIAFAIVAVATVFLVRRFARPDAEPSDLPDLNERGRQYVGRKVLVEEPIANGRGRVRVGDTLWHAEGPDAPKGARMKVTGSRGTVLVVEREPA
jgi:membrane protein implicated in regulation of membrane protease activity